LNTAGVSVVIPTYNRKDSLLRTLDSLSKQTYPSDRYEIIIVDDGSTDGTEKLMGISWPFRVRYYRQENAGATAARNAGARRSLGQILVFMDDDIAATPRMLESLIEDISALERSVVLGTLIPTPGNTASSFAVLYSSGAVFPTAVDSFRPKTALAIEDRHDGRFVHFTKCMTGVLAVRNPEFQALNMFQDPTGGWPSWEDVDFGYRAHLAGFRLWRSYRAVAYHYDHSLASLESSCERLERASRAAARLFERYPELARYMSYIDKGPIALPGDPLLLVVRKAVRGLVSSPLSVSTMRRLTRTLEKRCPDSSLLVSVYRWILSACMYKGYRRGLLDLAEADS
jgi:glycosyltransferase involved in cell wall biosynthesis